MDYLNEATDRELLIKYMVYVLETDDKDLFFDPIGYFLETNLGTVEDVDRLSEALTEARKQEVVRYQSKDT